MRLYVGGLAGDVKEEELCERFSRAAGSASSIQKVEVMKDPDTGRSRGFAYIDVNDESSATKCIKAYNRTAWRGGKLRVEQASESYKERLEREWKEQEQLRTGQQQQQQQPPTGSGAAAADTVTAEGAALGEGGEGDDAEKKRYLRIRRRPGEKALVVDTVPALCDGKKRKPMKFRGRKITTFPDPGEVPPSLGGGMEEKEGRHSSANSNGWQKHHKEKPVVSVREEKSRLRREEEKEEEEMEEEEEDEDEEDGDEEEDEEEGMEVEDEEDDDEEEEEEDDEEAAEAEEEEDMAVEEAEGDIHRGNDEEDADDLLASGGILLQEDGQDATFTWADEQQQEEEEEEERPPNAGEGAVAASPTRIRPADEEKGPKSKGKLHEVGTEAKADGAQEGVAKGKKQKKLSKMAARLARFDDDDDEEDDELGRQGLSAPATAEMDEEEDEVTKLMKEEVGKSLSILSLVLKDAEIKEAQEVNKVKAREQRRAASATTGAASSTAVPRFDPTRPDSSLMVGGVEAGEGRGKKPAPAATTHPATKAPASKTTAAVGADKGTSRSRAEGGTAKEEGDGVAGRKVEADVQALTSIYRAFRESEEERPAPLVVATPEPVGFSFGFNLAGGQQQQQQPSSSEVPVAAGTGRVAGGMIASTESAEEAEEGQQKEEEVPEGKEKKGQAVLWLPLEEYEARAMQFIKPREPPGGADHKDSGSHKKQKAASDSREREALRKSRLYLVKDFKRKRREAVKKTRLIIPKHA